MAQGTDDTTVSGRISHEAIEENNEESSASKLDKVAMEAAKRGQNRIHADETNIPGSSEFTH